MEATCKPIRDAMERGETNDAIDAHLAVCEACRLAQSVGTPPAPTTPARDHDRYRNATKSGNATRLGLAAWIGSGVFATVFYFLRPDFANVPVWFFGVLLVLLASVVTLAQFATRPLYVADAKPWKIGLAAAVATLAALAPMLMPSHEMPGAIASRCFFFGLTAFIPFVVFGLVRQRVPRHMMRSFLLVLAGAALANLLLAMHCPVSLAKHIMTEHVSLIVVAIVLGAAWVFSEKR